MSIFGSIMEKIWNAAGAVLHTQQAAEASPSAASATPAPTAAATIPPGAGPPAAAAPAAQAAPVDVDAVLTKLASAHGGGGNWDSSIVDLLKLLDLDSSLSARKQLAGELNVHVGADGTAEENIALHKAVMQALAANGGTVPDRLKN